MRYTGAARRLLTLCVAAVAVTGCGSDKSGTGPPPPPVPTFVQLSSDAGDYIGAGEHHKYTDADADITVMATGGLLEVHVDGTQWWYGDFQAPAGIDRFVRGTYTNLTRYPFHDPAVGGLSWYGDGRGCNTLTGWFAVDSVQYVGDSLAKIDVRFEQHCEGGTAALRGTIHWAP